jgi:hypothetical protein
MEIGAVALLGIAGVQHVTVPPSGARLVIPHGGENVIVDCPRLIERRSFAFGHFDRQFRGQSGDRHQLVGLQIFLAIAILELNFGQARSRDTQGQALMLYHVIGDFEVQLGGLRFGTFGVVHFVAGPRLARFLQLQVAICRDHFHFLELV